MQWLAWADRRRPDCPHLKARIGYAQMVIGDITAAAATFQAAPRASSGFIQGVWVLEHCAVGAVHVVLAPMLAFNSISAAAVIIYFIQTTQAYVNSSAQRACQRTCHCATAYQHLLDGRIQMQALHCGPLYPGTFQWYSSLHRQQRVGCAVQVIAENQDAPPGLVQCNKGLLLFSQSDFRGED